MKNSLLWEIEADNRTAGYLFGSMHLSKPEDAHLVSEADLLLDRVQSLVLEFNPGEVRPEEIAGLQQLPHDMRLSELMDERRYERVRWRIKRFSGVDIIQFDQFPPLYILNVIYSEFLTGEKSFSMDFHLYQKAVRRNIPVSGLESVASQSKLINEIPIDFQIRALQDCARRMRTHREKILRSAEMYRLQEIHQLYRTNKKQMGPLRRTLIYERNFNMADRIEEHLRSQSALIAVGAGHLSGKFGLIRLLKRCGYRLKGVKNIKTTT